MKRRLLLFCSTVFLTGCAAQPSGREVIATKDAPATIGPYSQAIRVGNTLYLAGQIAVEPATGNFVTGGIQEQTHQVLTNIKANKCK